MTIRLGDTAPDFEQDSSEGRIRFHEWLGDSWGILFSHPADFTPVCTTELGFTAKLKDQFAQRGVKVLDEDLAWLAEGEPEVIRVGCGDPSPFQDDAA